LNKQEEEEKGKNRKKRKKEIRTLIEQTGRAYTLNGLSLKEFSSLVCLSVVSNRLILLA